MSAALQPPSPSRRSPARLGANQPCRGRRGVAAGERCRFGGAAEVALGRVALAAVAEPFDEVGAAVPLRRLLRIGLELASSKYEQVPACQHRPPAAATSRARGGLFACWTGATRIEDSP